MKDIFWTVILVAVFTISFELTSSALDRKEAVAFWDFEDVKGDVVPDITGNGHEGAIKGNVDVTDGKYGQGLKFDGKVGSVVIVENHKALQITEDITMEGWVFPTSPNQGYVVGKQGSYGMPLWNNLEVKWVIWGGDWFTGIQPKVDEWNHIALVYDFKAKTRLIYLNGKEEGDQKTTMTMPVSPHPLTLGQWVTLTGQERLIGIIDDIGIWNRPLSADEINKSMEPSPVEPKDKLATMWSMLKKR